MAGLDEEGAGSVGVVVEGAGSVRYGAIVSNMVGSFVWLLIVSFTEIFGAVLQFFKDLQVTFLRHCCNWFAPFSHRI